MNTIGTCRLCGKTKPLIGKSHIIPSFMYWPVFAPNSQKTNRYSPSKLTRGEGWVERPTDGEYESGILCAECDNVKIGQNLEDYGAKAINEPLRESPDLPEWAEFRTGEEHYIHGRRLDYRKFKLLLLSILWRASISSRPFFSQVNLGPYAERIRQMILNGDAGDVSEFPILIVTWLHDPSHPHGEIYQPTINRKESGIRYIFPIAGAAYIFHINNRSLRQEFADYILSPSNEIKIVLLPQGKISQWLSSYCKSDILMYSAHTPDNR